MMSARLNMATEEGTGTYCELRQDTGRPSSRTRRSSSKQLSSRSAADCVDSTCQLDTHIVRF